MVGEAMTDLVAVESEIVAWCNYHEMYSTNLKDIGKPCWMSDHDNSLYGYTPKFSRRRGYICRECELAPIYFLNEHKEFLRHHDDHRYDHD